MVVGWIVIGAIIIFAIFMITRSQDMVYFLSLGSRYFLLFLMVVIVFFLAFSFYRIGTTNDLDFTSFKGVVEAGGVYFTWFKGILSNIGNIGGYAVKQDWINASSSR